MTQGERIRTWLVVVAFAIGMAWVESACVYYLRVLVDRVEPYQPNPLPISGALGAVELVREAATLLMLLTLGILAGRTWHTRIAYAAIAFGVWDIFYYVFLRVMTGWPRSLFDWDVLFLLPLPWWGPVIAPVSIAVMMVVGGTIVTLRPTMPVTPVTSPLWRLNWIGIALALYVFMADSLAVVRHGMEATTTMLPEQFNWPIFVVALVLMAAPLGHFMRGPFSLTRTSART
jgi:hypothetical protein